jgi:hypothetical protein
MHDGGDHTIAIVRSSVGAGRPRCGSRPSPDELAAPAYDVLSADELDELLAGLEPIADAV